MMAWMALPLHTPTIAGLPNETEVTAILKGQNLNTGVYTAPMWESDADMSDAESKFYQNHLAGPVYSIYYQRDGMVPMGPKVLMMGLVIDFLAALLVAMLLAAAASGCCKSYGYRVGFVVGMGMFTALIGHVSYWNWMNFPLDYTVAFVIDNVVGWTLAGLVIAAIVTPTVCAPKTADADE
jgi:hypothetical protein